MLVVSEQQALHPHPARKVAFGQINFVNCLPIVVPMNATEFGENVRYGTPSELNAAFEQGFLDAGAMSSFYFLRSPNLKLIPDICIASEGAVSSVMCYSKRPLGQLDGQRVSVPVSSATSTNLLRILLMEVFGVRPKIIQVSSPDIDDPDIAAVLVIGDHALKVHDLWKKKYVTADLGEWWHINYQLPMVFGLWAARRDWAKDNHDEFLALCKVLRDSVASGLDEMFEQVLDQGCKKTGLSRERMIRYFKRDLQYTMTPRHLAGLRKFGELSRKHGFFDLPFDCELAAPGLILV